MKQSAALSSLDHDGWRAALGGSSPTPRCAPVTVIGFARSHVQTATSSMELCETPCQRFLGLTIKANTLVLVHMVRGRGDVQGNTFAATGDSDQILLLARPGETRLVWHPDSEGLIVTLDRSQVQIAASRIQGEPLRVGASNLSINLASNPALRGVLGEISGELRVGALDARAFSSRNEVVPEIRTGC